MTTVTAFSWKRNLKRTRYTKTIVTTLTEKNNITGEETFYQFHGHNYITL